MKKRIKFGAIILSAVLTLFGFGCGEVDLDEDEKDGTDIEISAPDYGFVKAEEFVPNTENPLEGTVKYFENPNVEEKAGFEVGTTYYLIIIFTVTPRQNNLGQSYFKTSAKFDNLDVLNATMQQTSTSLTSVVVEQDMKENKLTRNVEASFSIPPTTVEVKNYTMIVRMVPNKVNLDPGVKIEIEFSLNNSAYKIWGARDGFSQTITIVKGKLATPELTYNYGTMNLEWKHVKNASYYVVYKDETPVVFNHGGVESEKIVATGDIRPGDTMEAVLMDSDLQSGFCSVKVKAFGENGTEDERFYSSNYSNIVGFDW